MQVLRLLLAGGWQVPQNLCADRSGNLTVDSAEERVGDGGEVGSLARVSTIVDIGRNELPAKSRRGQPWSDKPIDTTDLVDAPAPVYGSRFLKYNRLWPIYGARSEYLESEISPCVANLRARNQPWLLKFSNVSRLFSSQIASTCVGSG